MNGISDSDRWWNPYTAQLSSDVEKDLGDVTLLAVSSVVCTLWRVLARGEWGGNRATRSDGDDYMHVCYNGSPLRARNEREQGV